MRVIYRIGFTRHAVNGFMADVAAALQAGCCCCPCCGGVSVVRRFLVYICVATLCDQCKACDKEQPK